MSNTQFKINDATDERHSQQISSAMIPVRICRDLECLDLCVDMLNNHPSFGRALVIRIFADKISRLVDIAETSA
jgi:hypothetical protein